MATIAQRKALVNARLKALQKKKPVIQKTVSKPIPKAVPKTLASTKPTFPVAKPTVQVTVPPLVKIPTPPREPPVDPDSSATLPYMAKKMTEKGEPWYGSGFKGWVRRSFGLTFDPSTYYGMYDTMTPEQEKATTTREAQKFQAKTRNLGVLWDTNMQWTGLKYSDLATAFGAMRTAAEEKELALAGKTETQKTMGRLSGAFRLAWQIAKNASSFKNLGNIIGGAGGPNLSIGEYAFRSVAANILVQAKTGEWNPAVAPSQEYKDMLATYMGGKGAVYTAIVKEIQSVDYGEKEQQRKELRAEVLSDMNALRKKYGGEPPPLVKAWIQFNEWSVGSKMQYDVALPTAWNQQFLARAERGEDPDFVAMEMANPWIELAGGLVFDPLNLIGGGQTERVAKLTSTRMEFGEIATEVNRVMKLAAESADDAPTAAKYLDEAWQVANQYAQRVASRQTQYATKFGPLVLTSTGKADIIFKTTNNVLTFAVGNAESLDEARDIVWALSRLGDANPEIARDAFFTLADMGPRAKVFLSPAGFETGAVLQRVIGNGEWIDEMMEIGGTKSEKLMKYLTTSMKDIAKEMYPSIDEMEAAAKKVAEIGIDKATPLQVKYATMYQGLDKATKSLAITHRIAQKVLYRPVNEFFARVYMGYSPGYAMRNMQNNVLTVLVDQGVVAGKDAFVTGLSEMWKPGGRTGMYVQDMKDFLGAVPSGIYAKGREMAQTAGVKTTTKLGKIAGPTLELSARNEFGTRVAVIYHRARAEIVKFLKGGFWLPDTSKYVANGLMDGNDIEALRVLMMQNMGVTPKAMQELRAMSSEGVLKVWELKMPDPKLFTYFEQTGMLKKMVAAQKSSSPAEFTRIVTEAWNEIVEEAGRLASKEPASVHLDDMSDDLKDLFATVDKASKEKYADDIAGQYLYSQGILTDKAEQAASDMFDDLANKIAYAGAPDIASATRAGLKGELRTLKYGRAADFRSFVNELVKRAKDEDPYKIWAEARFMLDKEVALGEAPKALTPGRLKQELYDWMFEEQGRYWTNITTQRIEKYKEGIRTMTANYPKTALPDFSEIDKTIARAIEYQQAYTAHKMSAPLRGLKKIPAGATLADLDTLSAKLGEFPYSKPRLFNMVNADREAAGVAKYANEVDVPMSEVIQAIQRREIKGMAPGPDWPVTLQRGTALTGEDMLPLFKRWQDEVVNNWGNTTRRFANPEKEKAFRELEAAIEARMSVARTVAATSGEKAADFALLDYNKYGIDLAMQYIMPYGYWYRGTYANWAKRFAMNPQILAGYMKYRRFMEGLHAGLPDWWKYNLSTNDIPGVDMENPLFWNLESTINPLNGITGVDFNDPYKRVDAWSNMVDDMGKYGPNIWTPYNWAIALHLWKKYSDTGEEKYLEARNRWMGRLIPQSSTAKAILSAFGAKGGLGNPYNEYDPIVALVMGGIDPYELRRANRELAYMVDSGEITREQQIDAASTHEGEIWDRAVALSLSRRALPNGMAFILGTGYKARTQSDLQIDTAYQEWNVIKASKANMSPEAYKSTMNAFFGKYTWFEGILIGGRNTEDRDVAYTYNILSRIPPSRMDNAFEAFGIDGDLVTRFYTDKGYLNFSDLDKEQFMNVIKNLGAVLALPDMATKEEWQDAKVTYSTMLAEGEKLFGATIWDQVAEYQTSENFSSTYERANFLTTHPKVEPAMAWRNAAVSGTPIIYKYYGSLNTINNYYSNLYSMQMKQKYGQDIYTLYFYYLELGDPDEQKAFLKEHPELAQFKKEKKTEWQDQVNKDVIMIGAMLPTAEDVTIRRGVQPSTQQEKLITAVNPPQTENFQYYIQLMTEPQQRLVADYIVNGNPLPSSSMSTLNSMANRLNIPGIYDGETFLQMLVLKYYQEQNP